MSEKADRALIGRCGLYCGACPVYICRFESDEFKERTSESWKISVDNCYCDGCGKPKEKSPCSSCEILICLNGKELSYCYECESYEKEDCDKFERIYKQCLESLGIDLRQSLERLFATTPEQWLEKNEQAWVCRTCGAKIPWGSYQCQRCRNPLH